MKKFLLLSSLFCSGIALVAANPQAKVPVGYQPQVKTAEKAVASKQVATEFKLSRVNAPVMFAPGDGLSANYRTPAGTFFSGLDAGRSGYGANIGIGGCYAPVTWVNASNDAESYSWTYTNPEFPEDESLQMLFSTETDLTVVYPYSEIKAPSLEAFDADGNDAAIDPYNGDGSLPLIYRFGGYDVNEVGMITYPKKGASDSGWSSLVQTGYNVEKNGQYSQHFDPETGTAISWAKWYPNYSNIKMLGMANVFPKPNSAYLTTKAWIWLDMVVNSATELTVTLYKIDEDGMVTDEVVAAGTTTVLPDVEYKTVEFDLVVLDEDGFETEDPVLIDSAVMMVLTGFSGENSGIESVYPVSGSGIWWDYAVYGGADPNDYPTHAYSYMSYVDENGDEQTGYLPCRGLYNKSGVAGSEPVFACTDYVFCLDYVFGACVEANNDYEFNASKDGGSKTFDFNVIYYISPEDVVVSEGADWIQTSIADANANGVGTQVKIEVAANTADTPRSATVTVSSLAATPKVITVTQATSGIEIVEEAVETVASEYYDLQGRKLYNEPANGLFIRKDIKADGSVKSVKVVK